MGRSILIAAMCVGLVGCQVSTAPRRVAAWDRSHAVSMMRSPSNGQYTLYRLPSEPNGQREVVQEAHLKKGDPLGFRQWDGGVVAVAGERELPLSDGAYEWIMQADQGQINPVGTAILAAVVVVAGLAFSVAIGFFATFP